MWRYERIIVEVVMSERAVPLPKISAARSERRAFIGGVGRRTIMGGGGGGRAFIGGSDARIIMGDGEAALLRLWREKRGEIEAEDLSGDLLVQLGTVTEHLNRHWFEKNSGHCSGRC